MPRLVVVLALLLAGCLGGRGSVLNPFDEAQVPRVEVHHLIADEPPVISWTPPDAEWVEVRHAGSGRLVWRIEAAAGRLGMAYVRSPLNYGSGIPHDVNPPDNAEPRRPAGPEPLAPGHRYIVTVHRRDERAAASGGGFTDLHPNLYETTVTFTASSTIPMD